MRYGVSATAATGLVEAFLTFDDALGLDVARDSATRTAMLRALPMLAMEPVVALHCRRLEADDFDRLSIGDPIRELLGWMNKAPAFERSCSPDRWTAFREICARDFGFDPERDGIRAAADALVFGSGIWDEVWERFEEVPKRYLGVPMVLRLARPKDLMQVPLR